MKIINNYEDFEKAYKALGIAEEVSAKNYGKMDFADKFVADIKNGELDIDTYNSLIAPCHYGCQCDPSYEFQLHEVLLISRKIFKPIFEALCSSFNKEIEVAFNVGKKSVYDAFNMVHCTLCQSCTQYHFSCCGEELIKMGDEFVKLNNICGKGFLDNISDLTLEQVAKQFFYPSGEDAKPEKAPNKRYLRLLFRFMHNINMLDEHLIFDNALTYAGI